MTRRLSFGTRLGELFALVVAGVGFCALAGAIEGAYLLGDLMGGAPNGGATGQAAGFVLFLPFLAGMYLLGGLVAGAVIGLIAGLGVGSAITFANGLIERQWIRWALRALWISLLGSLVALLLFIPAALEPLLLRAGLIPSLPRHGGRAGQKESAPTQPILKTISVRAARLEQMQLRTFLRRTVALAAGEKKATLEVELAPTDVIRVDDQVSLVLDESTMAYSSHVSAIKPRKGGEGGRIAVIKVPRALLAGAAPGVGHFLRVAIPLGMQRVFLAPAGMIRGEGPTAHLLQLEADLAPPAGSFGIKRVHIKVGEDDHGDRKEVLGELTAEDLFVTGPAGAFALDQSAWDLGATRVMVEAGQR